MPASAASVVAKLATNPATAQTVPKSLRNLRPLREKSTGPFPIPRKERKERRVPYISYHANLCVKKAKVPFASGIPKTN